VMAMAERVGQAAFLRQQHAILNRPDGRPDLPAITCPALVVCGRQDVLTPPALAREIAAAIPHTRLLELDECGHLSSLEQPELVNQAFEDWLAPEL